MADPTILIVDDERNVSQLSRMYLVADGFRVETVNNGKDALERVREAAQIFRRSGVRVELDADEERIFAAVVRPERSAGNGNVDAELERLRKEVERAEAMLANGRFVQNAPAHVVEAERAKLARYRRELEALGGTERS